MTTPKLDRRQMLKLEAAAIAAAAAGMPVPALAANLVTEREASELKWDKAAVPLLRHRLQRDGRDQGQSRGRHPWRHQVRGQSRPELREGLFPLQDHVRPRPPDPADAAQDGRQIRQERRVHAGLVGRSLRHHGREIQGRAEEARAVRRRHVRLGPVDDLGRLRRLETVQGRLPLQQYRSERAALHGLGGRRHDAHLRHRRARRLLRRHRGHRRLRAVGLQHGGDAPDPVDAGDRPPAFCAACARRRALDLRAPLVRPRRYRHGVQAADRSLSPQCDRQSHHQDRAGQQGVRHRARRVQARPDRHRLWPAAGTSAADKGDGRGQAK